MTVAFIKHNVALRRRVNQLSKPNPIIHIFPERVYTKKYFGLTETYRLEYIAYVNGEIWTLESTYEKAYDRILDLINLGELDR